MTCGSRCLGARQCFMVRAAIRPALTRTRTAPSVRRPDPGIDAKLKKRDDGSFELEWHSKDKYLFSSAGRWTEHRDRNGNSVRFAYNIAGRVSTITDTR